MIVAGKPSKLGKNERLILSTINHGGFFRFAHTATAGRRYLQAARSLHDAGQAHLAIDHGDAAPGATLYVVSKMKPRRSRAIADTLKGDAAVFRALDSARRLALQTARKYAARSELRAFYLGEAVAFRHEATARIRFFSPATSTGVDR